MNEAGVRVAAVLVAVGLIGGALVLRSRMDDSDGSSSGNGDGGDAPAQSLVCPPELEDGCNTLAGDFDVVIEDAQVTGDRLTEARRAGDGDGDLWLTTSPWVEAVNLTRETLNEDPILGETSEVLARSPILIVVREDRAAGFEAVCSGTIDWKCLGNTAEQQWGAVGGNPDWGTVRVGMTDPATATGLPVVGNATAGFLGRPDYATNDLDNSVTSWLRGFAAGLRNAGGGSLVDDLLTRGAGVYAAVGALEVDARVAADRQDARVVVPDPLATADLVVVPIGDTNPDEARDVAGDENLLAALAEQGWRVPDQDAASGVDAGPDLPRRQGFPNGAVLRGVLLRWDEL